MRLLGSWLLSTQCDRASTWRKKELVKIEATVVKRLTKAVREQNVVDDIVGPTGQQLRAYYTPDITVSFDRGSSPAFFGATFELFGQEFTILPDFEILVSLPKGDDASDEIYSLSDEELVHHVEAYLLWRTEALERFSI